MSNDRSDLLCDIRERAETLAILAPLASYGASLETQKAANKMIGELVASEPLTLMPIDDVRPGLITLKDKPTHGGYPELPDATKSNTTEHGFVTIPKSQYLEYLELRKGNMIPTAARGYINVPKEEYWRLREKDAFAKDTDDENKREATLLRSIRSEAASGNSDVISILKKWEWRAGKPWSRKDDQLRSSR